MFTDTHKSSGNFSTLADKRPSIHQSQRLTQPQQQQQQCPAISINVRSNPPDQFQRSIDDDQSRKGEVKFQQNKDSIFSDPRSSIFSMTTTATQPRPKKNFKSLFSEGGNCDDDDTSSYITTVKQSQPSELKGSQYTRLALDDSSQERQQIFTTPIGRLAFTEDLMYQKRENIFNKREGGVNSNVKVMIDPSKKESSFQGNIFASNPKGPQASTSSFFDQFLVKKPDSTQKTVKNGWAADTANIVSANTSNKTLTSTLSPKSTSVSIKLKRPFFLFEDDVKLTNQKKTTFDDALDSLWNDPRYLSLKRAQSSIWDQPKEQSGALDQAYGQVKKPKQTSIVVKDKHGNIPSNTEAYSESNQVFVPFEKLRYTSMSSYQLKHFEFNCFKDKDLRIDDQFQKKVQDITIDDDVETDDDTLDNYIEVCFSDLIEAIDMQHKDAAKQASKEAESSQTPLDIDHLWDYFYPPCHAAPSTQASSSDSSNT